MWMSVHHEKVSKGKQGFIDRVFDCFLIYLFMNRHEVHSMSTHTLQNAGR